MMSLLDAAWVLKNERSDDGNHSEALAALENEEVFLRIIHGSRRDGEWPILSVEPVEPPPHALTLYRRSAPEHVSGIFWTTSWFAAFLHTADRSGLAIHEAVFEPADLVAEFVMQNRFGHTSGGEFIAIRH